MPIAGEQSDALRLQVESADVLHLAAVQTVPGVVPLAAAARNGPGYGRLQSADGARYTWTAPGSATPGPAVHCSVDGDYLLLDGEDLDKWLRIRVYTSFTRSSPVSTRVHLADVYAGGTCHADVLAAEASAGDVSTYTITLANAGRTGLDAIVCWVDAGTSGIEISADGVSYSAPNSEATGLALGSLAIDASTILYLRRAIDPGAEADPDVLDLLHFAFDA